MFVSAHAPYVGCKESFSDWWIHFTSTIKHICNKGCPIIIGIDGNCKCYVNACEGIGHLDITRTRPSPNHNRFVNFVDSCDMNVCNTFPDLCKSTYLAEPYTYVSTVGGNKSRIDYLMCNNKVMCLPKSI